MKKTGFYLLLSMHLLSTISCENYLEEKSDSRQAIPNTLEDNQALLDRSSIRINYCSSGEISADDLYLTDTDFSTISNEFEKRLYTWQPDRVANEGSNDWANAYGKIYVFNTVLSNLSHYMIPNSNNVKGQALTYRALVYLEAAQLWCPAYNSLTADEDLGLPLRLDPDMNIPSVRSSVNQTYEQILTDLHQATELLPVEQISIIRPSKVTSLGYLARTYLFMGDYQNALHYSQEALSLYSTLLDYNTLDAGNSYPIKARNEEVLLPITMANFDMLNINKAKVPLSIYEMYDENDLRKTIFFRDNGSGEFLFKGNYTGGASRMNGLTVPELYLIAAESAAQLNQIELAMSTLNSLLIKRWANGTFIPLIASSPIEVLNIIRKERRKELLFRGLRWSDLKRYNRDGGNITISRNINGETLSLPSNDLRYAIAIPEDIILMTGMRQNPR